MFVVIGFENKIDYTQFKKTLKYLLDYLVVFESFQNLKIIILINNFCLFAYFLYT